MRASETEHPRNRITVLMISKALVSGAYHGKLAALAALGVDLHLVVPPAWGSLHLEIRSAADYEIHVLPIAFNGHHHFHFYRGLKNLVRRVRPTIVHIDEEHYSVVTFQAMRRARAEGAKTLFFTWQNIYKRYPFPFSAMERYNLSHANAAIAGSGEAGDVLAQKGFDKTVRIIPQFGVDPEQFRPLDRSALRRELGLDGARLTVGFVGRLVPEKGVLALVEAVGRLETARLVVIGDGPLRGAIEATAGLKGRVAMVGRVESTRMPDYYNCLDCLVLPSETRPNWKEQFGRALIEAMACGVPVVGTRSGEIPRVIGEAGLIVPEGDAVALKGALERLAGDAALRADLGARGRARVTKMFTHWAVAEATAQLYEEMAQA